MPWEVFIFNCRSPSTCKYLAYKGMLNMESHRAKCIIHMCVDNEREKRVLNAIYYSSYRKFLGSDWARNSKHMSAIAIAKKLSRSAIE